MWASVLTVVPALIASAWAAAPALAQGAVLGVPCTTQSDGVRVCTGSVATPVRSWDGTPLDVDITLPPASSRGPYPLIFGIHGFAATKLLAWDNPQDQNRRFARQGYATVAYSARGLGFSCGTPAGGALPGCSRGWIHLADARFEVRDTQHLAGLLVDAGVAQPDRIGVTGSSYGGGQSLMLATLRDRVMMPDGSIVPWRSPNEVPMRIAAAAPRIGWSDLAYALVPSGRTLDYRARNTYESDVGIVKQSYLEGLFATTYTTQVARPGEDPEADITTWKNEFAKGDPYDQRLVDYVKALFERYRSPYYVQAKLGERDPLPPAPLLMYNGFTDDIMPADESIRFANLVLDRFPGASVGMVFGEGFAHNRGSLAAEPVIANRERDLLFARYLKGDASAKPLVGAIAMTQGCGGAPALGPFRSSSWRAQHPGEVRFGDRTARRFDSRGGDAGTALATDPFAGGTECPQVEHRTDPGSVTYELPPSKRGYTLVGSPTVVARVSATGPFPQIDTRLWDVGPDGRQTLVTRGSYRPDPSGRQVFQMHPAGWYFAAGHQPKVELLGRDSPYSLPSNSGFTVRLSEVGIDLPVHERPDGDQILPYDPPKLCTAIGRSARRGRRLGPAMLGRLRRTNRRAFQDFRAVGRYMDRFCVTGGLMRVGYPSKLLSRRARRVARGRAVLLLASTPRISAARVTAGTSERAMRRRVKPRWRFRIGRNTWYVKRSKEATLVYKVLGRRVREVGIAAPRLSVGRASARRLLASYR